MCLSETLLHTYCMCVYARSTYGASELHFHFKATSQQQQKLLSSINVILGRESNSVIQRTRHTQSFSDNYSPGWQSFSIVY